MHLTTAMHRLVDKAWYDDGSCSYLDGTPITLPYGSGTRISFNGGGQFIANHYFFYYFDHWEFTDHKNKIRLTTGGQGDSEYSILKLTKESLWLQKDDVLYKFRKGSFN